MFVGHFELNDEVGVKIFNDINGFENADGIAQISGDSSNFFEVTSAARQRLVCFSSISRNNFLATKLAVRLGVLKISTYFILDSLG